LYTQLAVAPEEDRTYALNAGIEQLAFQTYCKTATLEQCSSGTGHLACDTGLVAS
jgi:hypothetical protein